MIALAIFFAVEIRQIDHPYLDSRSNGSSHHISRMFGQSLDSHNTWQRGERSPFADLASVLLMRTGVFI